MNLDEQLAPHEDAARFTCGHTAWIEDIRGHRLEWTLYQESGIE